VNSDYCNEKEQHVNVGDMLMQALQGKGSTLPVSFR